MAAHHFHFNDPSLTYAHEAPNFTCVLLYHACSIARKLLVVVVILSHTACTLLLAHFD